MYILVNIITLAILGGIAMFIITTLTKSNKRMICKSCGTIGSGKLATKGSLLIEIVLWLCLIIPGLIYSIWRHTSRYTACPTCGGKELVPVDSPIGKKLAAEYAPPPKP